MTKKRQKIFLLIFGIILSLMTLEAGLHLGGFALNRLQQAQNSQKIKEKDSYRILCLGESTTAFGGEFSYPDQLQNILNKKGLGLDFRVINQGMIGSNSYFISKRLGRFLDQYDPDMVIVMMGINDPGQLEMYKNRSSPANIFLQKIKVVKLAKLIWMHIKERESAQG